MLRDKEKFKYLFIDKVQTMYGIGMEESSDVEKYIALSSMIKDHIYRNWVYTNKKYDEVNAKQMYYFSIEFLPGKQLGTNLTNMGLTSTCRKALKDLGVDLKDLEAIENDSALGSGGLGRLGSCFLESLAANQYPGHGCSIKYKYGLFGQKIIDDEQVEVLDNWLEYGNVWEVRKPNKAVEVNFYGNIGIKEENGKERFAHNDSQTVLAVPHDMPIVGYKNDTVNTLRLFSAEPKEEIDFTLLTGRETKEAISYENSIKGITEVLYPDDSSYEGKILRLKQQYFFVSAGLQTILKKYIGDGHKLENIPKQIAVHINDTHPSLAIPELMRLLMDEHGLGWDESWKIVKGTISYTNHTILPEALEKWNIGLFKELLPRIFMIIEEIDRRFKEELKDKCGDDYEKIEDMAILSNDQVHMAHLAIVGSYSVNGVAKVHTEILKAEVMNNFYTYYPEKFNNKTNGITHRNWLLKSNPSLTKLVTEAIGDQWIKQPDEFEKLLDFKDDKTFKEELFKSKTLNKQLLAQIIKDEQGIILDENSIFDIQVKRIHEYKRQLLNVFNIMDMYFNIKDNPNLDVVPRTFIFGGKAAPGYFMAKRVINLINVMADIVNNDKTIKDKIKIVFLDGYRVSLAERVFPACDVSEQISTASKEASGTGNMKFMLNGALTIGTLDGANIEIRDAVGDDNFFKFGLTVEEVLRYYEHGGYNSWDVYNNNYKVKRILDSLIDGTLFGTKDRFRPIYEALLNHNDQYFVLKDFCEYVKTQEAVDKKFRDKSAWCESSIINIAKSGRFSSDRTIREYVNDIWKIREVSE